MAKNITLMGASYTDVPAVVLPQTGGGTARFDDASVTTATAPDVTQGKIFLAADGTPTVGTASGGGDIKSLIDGSIAELTLPAGLKEIRNYAFHNCESLDIDEIPNGICIIGEYAFGN